MQPVAVRCRAHAALAFEDAGSALHVVALLSVASEEIVSGERIAAGAALERLRRRVDHLPRCRVDARARGSLRVERCLTHAALASGALQALHTAFSREGPAKVYVQHRMAEPPNAAAVWEVLRHDEGHVYIAGASKQMPKDVRAALVRAAVDHGGLEQAAAEALLKRLEAQRRLQCETW